VDSDALLERAATAKRASKRVAFTRELALEDVVAMANSGGGVIVLGDDAADVDRAHVRDALLGFDHFDMREVTRNGKRARALVVGEAGDLPLELDRTVYFRHGGKSGPATADDVRRFIDRRLRATRRRWLRNIRQVVTTEAPAATMVRVSDDPTAPVVGRVDPDQTHPYRQKEAVQTVNDRLPPGTTITPYDVLSVRRVHGIDDTSHPEFAHRMKFGSIQYSEAFVDWLVEQQRADPAFFEEAKARYSALRRRTRG
jgi:hypothetical protein